MMDGCLIAPDAERFPLRDEDHRLAGEAGLTIVEIRGHELADLRALGDRALGCLVWSGHYGMDALDAMPRLRVLARCGVGYDNVDVASARSRQVGVTYCPGLLDESVAEHALALLFALSKKLVASDAAARQGTWLSSAELAPIRSIAGSTLGLIGYGRIARRLSALVKALGMSVVVHDPFLKPSDIDGFRLAASLGEVLRTVDFVSLHLPLTPATRHLIGEEELAMMRASASLINTSRGGLVDSGALVRALNSGLIAGAAFDVFDPEPIPHDHPILSMNNTVITPHSSAYESTALSAIRQQAISDAIAVIQGREPQYGVPSTV